MSEKSVIFVMGPSCAGKTFYIDSELPDYFKVDLLDFQNQYAIKNYETIKQSYEDCKNGLKKALQEHNKVVLEHTLLRAERRKPYIDIVYETIGVYPEIICLIPREETYIRNFKERHKVTNINSAGELNMSLAILECPSIEEGFTSVTTVVI